MIQARTGSNRLHGKVLELIENKPMIWHVINRVKRISNVKQIILITTKKEEDKKLQNIAKELDILNFQGDENDVLNRHYQCALEFKAGPIIRITGDCPLVDPSLVDSILEFFLAHEYDYVSNTINPTFPDGLDTEIFSFKTLEKCAKNADLPSEREHVTSYIINHPNEFKIFNYENQTNLSSLRWTVDKELDLDFVRKVYDKMSPSLDFSSNEVLKMLDQNPDLSNINKGIQRNEGWEHSLKFDKIKKK